jgi:hypothetical protein
MKKLIHFLRSRDLISPAGVNEREISSYNLSKFVDLSAEIEKIIEDGHQPINNPFFSHSASLGLGGSALECRSVSCRLERINKLARFALMYSDKVVISSFFADYKNLSDKELLNQALQRFYEDLIVLFEMKSAISNGFIQFFSPETRICFTCQAEMFLGKQAASRFSSSYNALQNEFLNNMSVTCEKRHDEYGFLCNGPYPYFDHGVVCMCDNHHQEILKRARILKNIQTGNPVNISKALTKKLKLHEGYAHQVATNAIYGLSTSKCLNTNFLTENELHLNLLNSLQTDDEIVNRNKLASNHMTSIVPFVEDVDINDLIKLRKREKESFIIYRKALAQAISEFVQSSGTFTEKDAKSLYSDVIAPSLASLDQKVKKAKKDLISKPVRSLTGVVGAISFGLLTGIIPTDISAIASAIGLAKFGSDFIKDTMATGDQEDVIKEQQYYFLWKVRQKIS